MNICEPDHSLTFPCLFLTLHTVGIYHSEELYDDPLVFLPERFLESEFGTKSGADTAGLRGDLHFGSGRVESFTSGRISLSTHRLCSAFALVAT